MRLLYGQLCWIGVCTSIALSCLADTVTLDNGDRISGTILRRDHGKLVIKTSYSGEVNIDLKRIRNLQSDKPKTVVLENEERLYGKISGDGDEITVKPTDKSAAQSEPVTAVSDIIPGVVTGREWEQKGHINIGGASSSGNTDVKRLHTDAESITARSKDRYTAGLVINYAQDQDVESESNALAYAKYDHFITPAWYAFLNTNVEHDSLKDIRARGVLGFGSGWQAIASKRTNLALESGLGYVLANFYSAPSERFPIVQLALRFDHYLIPEKVQFFQKSEAYVSLRDARNSFAHTATGFRFHLHDHFIATTEYDVKWDGEPAPGSVSTDEQLLFSLGYKW